ncbi:MAG TPA: GNAT family N-acetyltransferase, partial [Microlunatus sp.]
MTDLSHARRTAGQPGPEHSARQAAEADLGGILELERVGFADADQWSEDSWRSELTEPSLQVMIIGTDRPLGVIALRTAGDSVELDRIVVRPDARRQGLARRLINTALGKI